jgi:hypothetical protein
VEISLVTALEAELKRVDAARILHIIGTVEISLAAASETKLKRADGLMLPEYSTSLVPWRQAWRRPWRPNLRGLTLL